MPRVSVIVGARGAAETLRACLEALRSECAGGAAEVIVAMPEGDPAESLVAGESSWARLCSVPSWPNLAELRGAALAHARAPIVAFTDAHCVVDRGWVAAIERALAGADVAAGAVRNGARPTAANWAAFLFDYGDFLPPIRAGRAPTLAGNNIAYRREVLGDLAAYALGGFSKAFVNRRLEAEGRRLVAAPEMVVTWTRDATLAEVVRLRFHFGRCFAATRIEQGDEAFRMAYRLAAPLLPLLVIARAAARVLAKPPPLRALLPAAPGLVAIAAAWGLGETVGALSGRGSSCREVY
jgi:glycosyltransferase involved in cell wall biosynthesis